MQDIKKRPILAGVNTPSDIKNFSLQQLQQLAEELREETIRIVSETGGHLGSGLGVIELTIALHYVFDTPKDLLVWDVGHQCYPHKIITGRKEGLASLRQKSGMSGFLKREESVYDVFGAGHSSTSISAALGLAVGRDIKGEDHHVVTIIGDGALSAGMAYEAINNAAYLKHRLLVILNDNEMSIAPAVGAMSQYLCRLISSKTYNTVRNLAKRILENLPASLIKLLKKTERYSKGYITDGNLFEELGFNYIGPVDGHSLNQLLMVLQNIRNNPEIRHPILLHVKTEKGHGFNAAKTCAESYHAMGKFNPSTGIQSAKTAGLTYTEVFSHNLLAIAKADPQVVAITAAMPSGTGLAAIAKHLPAQVFDVGIAEQHAVTFAAGLAVAGIKPFVAIYSTFLQRAYDQIVHDVALQKLPVRFIIDRAGLVGPDGATHAGIYDIAFLSNLPNMIVMAAADQQELADMVHTCYHYNQGPIAVRFPRGVGNLSSPPIGKALPIGKARIIQNGTCVLLISFGTILQAAMLAAELVDKHCGVSISIIDARFAKPLDEELILRIAKDHEFLLTLEEGASGGFGAIVAQLLLQKDYSHLRIRNLCLPDHNIEQATQIEQQQMAGLDAEHIYQQIRQLIECFPATTH